MKGLVFLGDGVVEYTEELELIEPFLFLAGRPDAAGRYARVIAAQLEPLRSTKTARTAEST